MLIKTIKTTEIEPGEIKRYLNNEVELAIFMVKDKYYATALHCAHQKAPLDEGYLEDDYIVVCPWHGAKFDIRNGEVKSLPATEGIDSYEVYIKDGYLYVDYHKCDNCNNCECKNK